jgi:hypothetical protein
MVPQLSLGREEYEYAEHFHKSCLASVRRTFISGMVTMRHEQMKGLLQTVYSLTER